MTIQTALLIVGIAACIAIIIFALIFALLKIMIKYRNKLVKLSIEELFEAVNIIVRNEISLYERNVFMNNGKIISNASYKNYYEDILKNVYDALSPDIISRIEFYINKKSLYTMISREIEVYLNSKVV